ncbi:MAG: hypothetical protein J0J01_10595 [Reyranella sp.]|uniref:hypothetical protein n=1 Tax=Reyranella sp. TaxID=1929291 RepID=UPI001AC65764|nr:hypothetical protein [Reyranella sp.]MBN9087344.1 hypothetical protein [Reyranella sp.]
MLEQAGFVQIGRSNQSEACYLARPGSTHLRIRVAAHEPVRSASIEGVVASIVFVNRHTDDVREWGEIDGERILVGTRRIKHTGLDRVDVDELVQEAVKEYDAVRAAEENRTKPLATRNS